MNKKENHSEETKDFYKRSLSPKVHIPKKLVHNNVEKLKEGFTKKPPFFVVDLPARALSMTVGKILPGEESGKHRHSYETIMFITEGEGYSMIEDVKVNWKAGDAVYFPVWARHYNVNSSNTEVAKYVSCDNAPQLHAFGLAMFEPLL